MKKSSFTALVLLICLLLTCCAPKAALRDDLGEGPLTEETAFTIVNAFNRTHLPAFSAESPLSYSDAYRFFRAVGLYDMDGEVREELKAYQDGDEYRLPIALVEDYLLSKFDVEIDRAPIEDYDIKSECYITTPYNHVEPNDCKVTIDSLTEQEDGSYLVIASTIPYPQEAPYLTLEQTFVIEYDGEYRFRSFSEKEKLYQELSDEEQRLVDLMTDYSVLVGKEFDDNAPLPFKDTLYYFSTVGFYGDTFFIRPSLEEYATGDFDDPYRIPAHIVEDYLLSKFITAADHSVDCYSDGFYTLTPNAIDYYYFYELVDYSKEGDIYTVTANLRSHHDADFLETHHYVLQMTETDYKYLAYSEE